MSRRTSHELFKSSPEVKKKTNKQTKQNDANRPMTERLLVFPGRLKWRFVEFCNRRYYPQRTVQYNTLYYEVNVLSLATVQ